MPRSCPGCRGSASRRTSGPCRARSRTRCPSTRTWRMRSTIRPCAAVLAGASAGRSRDQRLPLPLHRQSEPVHFFWGSFDLAVTRFSGRRRRRLGRHPQRCRLGHGRGLFARGLQLRVLARQRRLRQGGIQRYSYPEPSATPNALRRPKLSTTRASASSSFPMMRCASRPTPINCSWGFSRRPTKRPPISRSGTGRPLSGGRRRAALATHLHPPHRGVFRRRCCAGLGFPPDNHPHSIMGSMESL